MTASALVRITLATMPPSANGLRKTFVRNGLILDQYLIALGMQPDLFEEAA